MHTGPQYTSTQQQGPTGGGRGTTLLIGGISFAVVFLLIVGVTVGYLVLKPGNGTTGGTSTSSASVTDPEASAGSQTPTPTDVEEVRCWSPDSYERTSRNPSGKLRGGGLQFIPPAAYSQRSNPQGLSYMDDVQGAQGLVTGSWYSGASVGAVVWQPGIEYPGAEVASQKIANCFFSASIWGDAKGRSFDDQITEPVTIAGLAGYRTTATVNFSSLPVEGTTATKVVVMVLETPQGPSAFITDTSVGVAEHEEASVQAYESLTGVA